MLVYKIWWVNCDKQHRQDEETGQKWKKRTVLDGRVPTIFVCDCRFFPVAELLKMRPRKDQQFMWEDAQRKSFQKLKDLLTRAETLASFKNERRTHIVADAGPTGIGAVLTQLQDGLWRVISYSSRNLTVVERRYFETEREGLALVWDCERFKLYGFGREFELGTDHKLLQYFYNKFPKPSALIQRWVLRLQDYYFKVIYRPGKTNIADALSRLNFVN